MTGTGCISCWRGSRRISPRMSSGIAGTPFPVYTFTHEGCGLLSVLLSVTTHFNRWGLILYPFFFSLSNMYCTPTQFGERTTRLCVESKGVL